MVSAWIEALREWNSKHNAGTWCVPRKGSKELEAARAILARIKKERGGKVEAPKAAKEKAPKMKKASPEVQAAFETAMKKHKEGESKKEKVKAFLKRALEKRREKKAKVSKVVEGVEITGSAAEMAEMEEMMKAVEKPKPKVVIKSKVSKPKPASRREAYQAAVQDAAPNAQHTQAEFTLDEFLELYTDASNKLKAAYPETQGAIRVGILRKGNKTPTVETNTPEQLRARLKGIKSNRMVVWGGRDIVHVEPL